MKKIVFFCLIGINIILSAWYLIQGDLIFHTDIARDFLLMDEITAKKIVLIGPRASGIEGLFHGPLWLYLNYPAYFLANGNPLLVGWWWVILSIAFLAICFYIAKKLFNTNVAYIYTLLLSANLIPVVGGLFNPFGAMFVLPVFFYLFIKFHETLSWKYLVAHIFVGGLMIQFQMALGIPLLLLSSLYIFYLLVKKRKYLYFLSFLAALLPLSTFIVFDMRHQFAQFHALMNSLSGNREYEKIGWYDMLRSRLDVISISAIQLFKEQIEILNIFFNIALAAFIYRQVKKKKSEKKIIYSYFAYLFIGFFLLTFLHNGWLLYHYWFPWQALLLLMFASFIVFYNNKLAYGVLAVVYVVVLFQNTHILFKAIHSSKDNLSSWKFLSTMANKVYDDAPSEFGLYIYTPDILAYQAKYTVRYGQMTHPNKQMLFNKKRTITYVLEEPPPKDRPYLNGDWWIKNKIKIDKKPSQVFTFPNGYKVRKYVLDEKEMAVSSDPTIDDWVTLR